MGLKPQTGLTPAESAYLDELAAEIVAMNLPADVSVVDALATAHERRRHFAIEMAMGTTKRARMARRLLQTVVWQGCQEAAARERLSLQAKEASKRLFLDCLLIDGQVL